MIESLRVLKACRETAVAARRIALQMIHNTIVCAPDGVRDTLRSLTRMQLMRTLAALRANPSADRDCRIRLPDQPQIPCKAALERHDESADRDAMIGAIVDELAPERVARNAIGQ